MMMMDLLIGEKKKNPKELMTYRCGTSIGYVCPSIPHPRSSTTDSDKIYLL
jgi:hypothetical protein